MTILTAIQRASVVIGIDVPTLVFASTEREHQELQALSIEMAARIAKEHDWNVLKVMQSMVGDDVTASFARPADYQRMLKEGQLWSSARKDKPLTHITDSDIWLSDQLSGIVPRNPQWTVIGTDLYVHPVIMTGETVSYFYIKKITDFTADTDTFIIDERLLTLGMIWQWKANKGLQYAEDMANYEIALDALIKEDMGAGILSVGSSRTRAHDDYVILGGYCP